MSISIPATGPIALAPVSLDRLTIGEQGVIEDETGMPLATALRLRSLGNGINAEMSDADVRELETFPLVKWQRALAIVAYRREGIEPTDDLLYRSYFEQSAPGSADPN